MLVTKIKIIVKLYDLLVKVEKVVLTTDFTRYKYEGMYMT